ncbi:MAG: hypothetical protein A2Y62_19005, partial [Candidatus Fischerbacteria bacterium RBG_13_37_8]
YPVSSQKSILHPKNIEHFCATCHGNVGYAQIYHIPAIKNEDCRKCHNMNAGEILPFDNERFDKAVHKRHFCVDCHRDIKNLPHDKKLQEVSCGACHQGEDAIFNNSIHGKALAEGVKEAARCWDCHTAHFVQPPSNEESATFKLNIAATCGKCHSNTKLAEKYHIHIKNPFALYQKSIHLKALMEGQDAPTCVNCHGDHNIADFQELTSPIFKGNLPKTCGECHTKAYKDFTQSEHWRAFLMGIRESPICNDCHLEHSIVQPSEPTSPVYAKNVPETCSGCHEAQRIIERYGIPAMRLSSYNNSYHGLALKAGNLHAANCTSCHDHHKILSSRDPASKTAAKNLPKTCGYCHPGVSKNIPIGRIHTKTEEKAFIFNVVTTVYIYLILITIGGMVVYCLLDFQKKVRYPLLHKHEETVDYYMKFNFMDRLLHGFHLLSFLVLVYTGFVHHYPDAQWAKLFIDTFGETLRSISHRVAGVILIIVFTTQIVLFIFTRHGRKQIRALFPVFKDVKDALYLLFFNIGIQSKKPKYNSFNFIEKFEFWALVWGNIVMGISGLALWFENYSLSIMAKWWLDLFILIHFYEAVLASLAILVWHLYWTIFDPEVYPLAKNIWTSKAVLEKEE